MEEDGCPVLTWVVGKEVANVKNCQLWKKTCGSANPERTEAGREGDSGWAFAPGSLVLLSRKLHLAFGNSDGEVEIGWKTCKIPLEEPGASARRLNAAGLCVLSRRLMAVERARTLRRKPAKRRQTCGRKAVNAQ